MGLRGARPKHYGGDVERSSSGTKIMLPKLTEQQNKFVLEYGSNGGRAIDAYKKAYDCSNMNNNSIYVEASRLLKNPKISPWIEYIEANAQKVAREELGYTIRDCFDEINEMKQIALNCCDKCGNPNVNAAIKAVELKGKLAGHFDKEEKESTTSQVTVMNEVFIDGEVLDFKVGEQVENEE